jgi:Protein of unknown function (DUF4031)
VTVYVDDMGMPAQVGGLSAKWSHLTADTVEELHQLAERIGLKREWFQPACTKLPCIVIDEVCPHFHYDVTKSKRVQAIRAGAQPVSFRQLGIFTRARTGEFKKRRNGAPS